MNQRNVIFPIERLDEVREALKASGFKVRIRYRGPRKPGWHEVEHGLFKGHRYYRDAHLCKSTVLKKDATGFVVYDLNPDFSMTDNNRIFPL